MSIVRSLIFLALVSCVPPAHIRPLDLGDRTCSTDWDCHMDTEHCGFKHVDSYAVCRPGTRETQ